MLADRVVSPNIALRWVDDDAPCSDLTRRATSQRGLGTPPPQAPVALPGASLYPRASRAARSTLGVTTARGKDAKP
jgi:hypothetical protein